MSSSLAWGLCAIVVLVAAVLAARGPVAGGDQAARPAVPSADPRLARCRQLGEAAGGDAACQAAWRAARARFFGRTAP